MLSQTRSKVFVPNNNLSPKLNPISLFKVLSIDHCMSYLGNRPPLLLVPHLRSLKNVYRSVYFHPGQYILFELQIVNALPTTGKEKTTNTIYL